MKSRPARCRKFMVCAGEVSGDVHGSYLVNELRKLDPSISFFGMGSERLAAAGVDIRFDITARGSIGILEALPNLLPVFSVFHKIKRLLYEERPDLVILIDSQGINLPIARACKKIGIKTVYYIAPQEWLWGTPRGLRSVASLIDLIVAIFPKEYEMYKSSGANVIYEGHPLIDIVGSNIETHQFGVRNSEFVISLCPGSRTHELNTMLPILLKSAKLIQKAIPDVQFLIPAASSNILDLINAIIRNSSFVIRNYTIVSGQSYVCLARSRLAICTSGTINLESSLLGTPSIMTYKLSPLTYFIGKYILKIDRKIKYFSMPNILLDKAVIPELVMDKATPELIARTALSLLTDQAGHVQMLSSFRLLRQLLGAPGVIARVADAILKAA